MDWRRLAAVTICLIWPAGSACPQMERTSSAQPKELLTTKLFILDEQSHAINLVRNSSQFGRIDVLHLWNGWSGRSIPVNAIQPWIIFGVFKKQVSLEFNQSNKGCLLTAPQITCRKYDHCKYPYASHSRSNLIMIKSASAFAPTSCKEK